MQHVIQNKCYVLWLLMLYLEWKQTTEKFFQVYRSRMDTSLKFHHTPSRIFETDLTFEKALDV